MTKTTSKPQLQKLLGTQNAKTSKGELLGWTTHILYLAPSDISGTNLCPKASLGCINGCLFTAGMGRFDNVKNPRIRKTMFFLQKRDLFFKQLEAEVLIAKVEAELFGHKVAIRLNGTSDISWENWKKYDGKNIFERFSDVQFYDYTKNYTRFKSFTAERPSNYHLTFSRSEENEDKCFEMLDKGVNVAFVFKTSKKKPMPTEYMGYKVIDGDEHDLRFLQAGDEIPGVIIGLSAKGDARKDTSGFVITEW